MAEFLVGLGGVAAGTQLLNYGIQILMAASALPRYIRHSPDLMQAWTQQSSDMLQLLEDVERRTGTIDRSTASLLGKCRKDALALRSLLVPFHFGSHVPQRSRLRELWFVLRKDHEVERITSDFNKTFSNMALHLIM